MFLPGQMASLNETLQGCSRHLEILCWFNILDMTWNTYVRLFGVILINLRRWGGSENEDFLEFLTITKEKFF